MDFYLGSVTNPKDIWGHTGVLESHGRSTEYDLDLNMGICTNAKMSFIIMLEHSGILLSQNILLSKTEVSHYSLAALSAYWSLLMALEPY